MRPRPKGGRAGARGVIITRKRGFLKEQYFFITTTGSEIAGKSYLFHHLILVYRTRGYSDPRKGI
jgi:hypothetical protein